MLKFFVLICCCLVLSGQQFTDEKTYLGRSSLKIEPLKDGGEILKTRFGTTSTAFIGIELQIPNSTHEIRCQLAVNKRRISQLEGFKVELIGGHGDNTFQQFKYDTESCHYVGLASFNTLPDYRGKCLFSSCRGVRSGIIWLPGSGDMSSLEFTSHNSEEATKNESWGIFFKQTSADVTLYGADLAGSVKWFQKLLTGNFNDEEKEQFLGETKRNIGWVQQLLLDSFPTDENWHHFRVMALITVESFNSNVLNGDPTLTVDVISSVFNFVNVIWSELNVAIYLKRIVIWTGYSPENGIEQMPEEYWTRDNESDYDKDHDHTVLHRLRTIALRHIWRQIETDDDAVDYIVTVRNLNATDPPRELDRKITLGLTYARSACNHFHRFGSILATRAVGTKTSQEAVLSLATIIAHELGHALGIQGHDDPRTCSCPSHDRLCLMHPTVDKTFHRQIQWAWSNCSIKSVENFLAHLIPPYCLKQIPHLATHYEPAGRVRNVCGNGILEEGEECDCGPGASVGNIPHRYFDYVFCDNPNCCDFATCKLAKHAQCAQGTCCDEKVCMFEKKNTLCRKPRSECDLPEICSGHSALCPNDHYFMTGTPCPSNCGDGTCYHGDCLSRSQRCETLMGGVHASLGDMTACYHFNRNGTVTANCGHKFFGHVTYHDPDDQDTDRITRCNNSDIECGTLMCTKADMGLLKKMSYKSHGNRTLLDRDFTCFSVSSEMLPDAGLVPDGMLCAEGTKYCVSQRCHAVLPKCRNSGAKFCDNEGETVDRSLTTASTIEVPTHAEHTKPAPLDDDTTSPLASAAAAHFFHGKLLFFSLYIALRDNNNT